MNRYELNACCPLGYLGVESALVQEGAPHFHLRGVVPTCPHLPPVLPSLGISKEFMRHSHQHPVQSRLFYAAPEFHVVKKENRLSSPVWLSQTQTCFSRI